MTFIPKRVIYDHAAGDKNPKAERATTMKYADCTPRQKKAYRNILNASEWLLGGLQNTLQDNDEGSEEYESAQTQLANHEGLVNELYRMATTQIFSDGACRFSESAEETMRDIRFCGKEWLMERCEARIQKAGY